MTWRQMDVAGAFGPTLRAGRRPSGTARCHPVPIHVTDPWDGSYTASQASISCRFKRWTRFVHRGFMGPSSFTWRSSTDLATTFWTKSSQVLEREPTLGANHDPTMQSRCIGGPPGATRCPRKLHRLSTAYKYPLAP